MNKRTIVWLVIAVSLILIGVIIFVGVMTMLGWNFRKLETVEYQTSHYEITDNFNNILIDTDVSDIEFLPSEDGKTVIKCLNIKDTPHNVSVYNETLKIELERKVQNWHIGINFETPKITVYMPKGEYNSLTVKNTTGDLELPRDFKFVAVNVELTTGDVKCYSSANDKLRIKTTTGDITIKDMKASQIDLSVTTGDTTLSGIKCNNFSSSGTTGDITLKDVIAKEKITLTRGTGDIIFNKCDANELYLKATTGDITGTLLSDKVFVTESTTGDVNVPKTTTGGKCEVEVTTGDIKIEIE